MASSEKQNEILAYLNGFWIEADRLSISFGDLGFLQGVTVVERLRTFGHRPFRLEEHMRRFRRSLEILGWDAGAMAEPMEVAVGELLPRNGALVRPGDDWSIVLVVTPGRTSDARAPTLCVHGHPLPFIEWADQYARGVEVAISDVRQVPGSCWPAELKCRSRMHYYLADRQAGATGPGVRALLVDQEGNLGEAATANVVLYFEGRGFVTPHRSKVLPGISLAVLLELASRLGIPVQEADIRPEELARADEVMLTSTSVCLLPVVRQNGHAVGPGAPGPIFRRLLQAWSELVGIDIADQARRMSGQ